MTEKAKEEFAHLTGLSDLVAIGAEHTDHGWHITVEAVEVHRIPEAHDIIGQYDLLLDDEGSLQNCKRTGRHRRDLETEEAFH